MSLNVNDMQQRVAAAVAMPSRIGYTLLMIAGAGMAAVTGSLAATEPSLPARTVIALSALALVGVLWTAFATWVLARRRVLLAEHRIIASRLAVAVCLLFTVGTVALRDHVPVAATAVGVVMLAAAAGFAWHAERYRARLVARRNALQGPAR